MNTQIRVHNFNDFLKTLLSQTNYLQKLILLNWLLKSQKEKT